MIALWMHAGPACLSAPATVRSAGRAPAAVIGRRSGRNEARPMLGGLLSLLSAVTFAYANASVRRGVL